MLDIKFVRENPEAVKENIKKKFQDEKLPLVDEVIELDTKLRAAITEANDPPSVPQRAQQADRRSDESGEEGPLQAGGGRGRQGAGEGPGRPPRRVGGRRRASSRGRCTP